MTQTAPLRNEGFQFEQSLRGIVERIAFELGDAERGDEYQTYDESWIQARVIDTMKWLQGRKPSLFASEKTITLEPGKTVYQRPENCDKLFQVTQVTDEKGRCFPVCEAKYKDIQASRRWAHLMPQCMSDFPVFSFAFNPSNPEEFLFDPVLTQGVEASITCSDIKQFFEDPDKVIDCEAAKYINTIIEYVKYIAMSMDSENVTLAALADSHRRTFFDLAPIRVKADDSDS